MSPDHLISYWLTAFGNWLEGEFENGRCDGEWKYHGEKWIFRKNEATIED